MRTDFASAKWRRSARSSSQGDQCVEVAGLAAAIGIRDSKNPDGAKLVVSRAAFGDLVARVKRGGHDPGGAVT